MVLWTRTLGLIFGVGTVSGAQILGFVFGVGNIILPMTWSFEAGLPKKHVPETWVTIMTGHSHDFTGAGGTEPFISLWDDEGKRVGQFWSDGKKKIEQNNELTKEGVYKIEHIQNRDPMVTPMYLMMSQWDTDAICISAVQVSNGKLSAVWYGDLGAFCGQSWYFSRRKPGKNLMHPKCVWLDADGTDNFNARAISFHINDMLGTPDKINMYKENPTEYLCKSTPRFAHWKHMVPDGTIPFFLPPLEYERDQFTGQEGRDKDPRRAVDRVDWDRNVVGEPRYNDIRSLSPPSRNYSKPRINKRQGFNHDPSHLIMTEAEGHEASAVCNSTTSYGWDVVSLRERKYCDMTIRKLYDLCGDGHKGNCFDLERKVLVGHGGINARGEVSAIGVPPKAYSTTDHWKE